MISLTPHLQLLAGSACSSDFTTEQSFPRLRRASNLALSMTNAVHNSLATFPLPLQKQWRKKRLALIHCTVYGNISGLLEFNSGSLSCAARANPNLFPETVFNAATSHVAATLEHPDMLDYTVLTSAKSGWKPALSLAEILFTSGQADLCLLVCAEDTCELINSPQKHRAVALWLQPSQNQQTISFIPLSDPLQQATSALELLS